MEQHIQIGKLCYFNRKVAWNSIKQHIQIGKLCYFNRKVAWNSMKQHVNSMATGHGYHGLQPIYVVMLFHLQPFSRCDFFK
jgi:hypothetical protein